LDRVTASSLRRRVRLPGTASIIGCCQAVALRDLKIGKFAGMGQSPGED
jgi:hypothetical protein